MKKEPHQLHLQSSNHQSNHLWSSDWSVKGDTLRSLTKPPGLAWLDGVTGKSMVWDLFGRHDSGSCHFTWSFWQERLEPIPGPSTPKLARCVGVDGVVQFPGAVQDLAETFSQFDADRWSQIHTLVPVKDTQACTDAVHIGLEQSLSASQKRVEELRMDNQRMEDEAAGLEQHQAVVQERMRLDPAFLDGAGSMATAATAQAKDAFSLAVSASKVKIFQVRGSGGIQLGVGPDSKLMKTWLKEVKVMAGVADERKQEGESRVALKAVLDAVMSSPLVGCVPHPLVSSVMDVEEDDGDVMLCSSQGVQKAMSNVFFGGSAGEWMFKPEKRAEYIKDICVRMGITEINFQCIRGMRLPVPACAVQSVAYWNNYFGSCEEERMGLEGKPKVLVFGTSLVAVWFLCRPDQAYLTRVGVTSDVPPAYNFSHLTQGMPYDVYQYGVSGLSAVVGSQKSRWSPEEICWRVYRDLWLHENFRFTHLLVRVGTNDIKHLCNATGGAKFTTVVEIGSKARGGNDCAKGIADEDVGEVLKDTSLCPGEGPMRLDDGTAVEGKSPLSSHQHVVWQVYRPCLYDAVGRVSFGGQGIKENPFDKLILLRCVGILDGGYCETFAMDTLASTGRQRGKDGHFITRDVVVIKETGVEKVVAVVHWALYWVVGKGGRQLVKDSEVTAK
ncbi:unnamed protein product [Notodromas monacha]|uniref:Uncharacterized protein n=1 Tax=Notodromas monacha TaxID=399045 RepID=A0A7R9GI06_9CRUS|nr:unnamed protein product [Notodromas monacha]CAG0923455.1 unnamed protein product [Notodromas monacha]